MNDLLVDKNIEEKKTNSDWIAPGANGENFFGSTKRVGTGNLLKNPVPRLCNGEPSAVPSAPRPPRRPPIGLAAGS